MHCHPPFVVEDRDLAVLGLRVCGDELGERFLGRLSGPQ